MSNAFHRRYKEITRAIEKSSAPAGVTGPAGTTAATPAGTDATTIGQIGVAVRTEVAAAIAKIDLHPELAEQLSRLTTRVDILTCEHHLSQLSDTVEGWVHNNYKQQNEQRRELCAALDAPLSTLLADDSTSLAAWGECKEDLPKHSNADSLRERQTHLYECIGKIRSALRRLP